MNSEPYVLLSRAASASLLGGVVEIASRAHALVRHARRRTRRCRATERPFARLPGAAAGLPRPFEVALREFGELPTYRLGSGLPIYGLGPPSRRPDLPPLEPVVGLLYQLAPDGVSVRAARRWEAEGLCFRLTHAATDARAYGAVPLPGSVCAVFHALEGALERLYAAAWGAGPGGELVPQGRRKVNPEILDVLNPDAQSEE